MVNAARFMKEAGCGAVKLEGGVRSAEAVHKLVEAVDCGLPTADQPLKQNPKSPIPNPQSPIVNYQFQRAGYITP